MKSIPVILIGFDFSINKPAMTVLYNKKYYHYFWPNKLNKKQEKAYKEANVTVCNRMITSVSKKHYEISDLVITHTKRSIELCNKIISDMDELIKSFKLSDYKLYICSEGLSFASKGDATLNLATYKGVLLAKLYEHFSDHLTGLYTYSPITIKATAECADKESRSDKKKMIQRYIEEKNDIEMRKLLKEGKLIGKKNYITGIDDIVDSYWALQTMIKHEQI